ncbi:MAG: sugar transferase [Candidatus Coproplasma sp.]
MIIEQKEKDAVNQQTYQSDGTSAIATQSVEEVSSEGQIPDGQKILEINQSESQKESTFVRRKGFRYGAYLFFKRFFDIVTSGLVLILFFWVYIILAILVKCSDGGSVIYKQKRVGKNGKPVYISKFRSMKKNADQIELTLTPEQLEQYKREFKIDNDPRITKIGHFLRKTSLDELPQVWDIFVGKLSVVGPRPLLEDEVKDKYGKDMEKLLSVKPGLIGWWACNGRSNVTYDSGERQKLELYYVDNCSFKLDTKIFFKTIGNVIRRDGAK